LSLRCNAAQLPLAAGLAAWKRERGRRRRSAEEVGSVDAEMKQAASGSGRDWQRGYGNETGSVDTEMRLAAWVRERGW
jgi:hypothetical protein